ncbi:MAG TPA: hypothetical protein VLT57_10080 [Bryobacteraceae bacterium]|nr:hypothetical protein [Bryobacteraceae bacterium]
MWRPLPYREPNRIVFLWEHKRQSNDQRMTVGLANYRDWARDTRALEETALVEGARYRVTSGGSTPGGLP